MVDLVHHLASSYCILRFVFLNAISGTFEIGLLWATSSGTKHHLSKYLPVDGTRLFHQFDRHLLHTPPTESDIYLPWIANLQEL